MDAKYCSGGSRSGLQAALRLPLRLHSVRREQPNPRPLRISLETVWFHRSPTSQSGGSLARSTTGNAEEFHHHRFPIGLDHLSNPI